MRNCVNFCVLAVLAIVTHSSSGSDDKIGFIFTAPKSLFSGTDERFCITFNNASDCGFVNVLLEEEKGHVEIASTLVTIHPEDNGGKCFNLSIPRTKSKTGRLVLTISSAAEDYVFNYDEQILIRSSPDVVFILTDKPTYSGGHSVKFRIFIVRSDLTPVDEDVESIWIENPNGVHLAQWLNESTSNGFIDKTFRLSEEPLTGVWSIKVKRTYDDVTSQSFRVEDYVLPRFAVTVDAPKVTNSSSDVNVTVCAKYMFGEPVHGTVNLQLNIKCSFSFYCLGNRTSPRDKLRLSDNGCVSHRYRLSGISNFARKIVVNATVKESGTGIEATSAAIIDIKVPAKGNRLEFIPAMKQKPFKPGLPFTGQVVYKSQATTPFDSDVLLCVHFNRAKECIQFGLIEGVGNFVLSSASNIDEKDFSVTLEMNDVNKFEESDQYNTKLNLVPWYSPSKSYIQLEEMTKGILRHNRNATFKIIFTEANPLPQFFFLVKSRGVIVKDGRLTPTQEDVTNYAIPYGSNVIGTGRFDNVREFTFMLNVTNDFSPGSHLLVYYIRHDGEVVADSLPLNVARKLKTPVRMEWKESLSLPGDVNRLEIRTVPNSVCAVSVTDRSTKFLTKGAEFDEDYIFKTFETKLYVDESGFGSRFKTCKPDSVIQEELNPILNFPQPDSRFVDSLEAFEDFGAIVLTNLALRTRPCRDDWKTEKSMGNGTARNFGSRSNVLGKDVDNILQPKKSDLVKLLSRQREMSLGFDLRHFFPETWIWDVIQVSESGTAALDVDVPHTITEWDSEAICLSKESGLGVADIKRMTTYQSFFIDFVVPRSVKRKEIFHLVVSVFNYENNNLPIKITYSPSNKLTVKTESSHSYCLKARSKVVHKFILEPVLLGEAVLTIMAEIDTTFGGSCSNITKYTRDTVSKNTFIKHEGFPGEDITSGFICANSKNFEEEISWSVSVPLDIIETSVTLDALVCGDILGPSLEHIDKLLTLPTGCGEQNMILLAPNILILEYLLLEESHESAMIEKALRNLDLGYQKQLNYRHGDGSYSAFGEKDEKGSIWLTAFVVRYLSQAQKFIHIDKEDLNVSVQWILRHQLENGCFPVIGKIYHRDLEAKFSENDSSKALTAYIIISLMESGLVSSSTPSMKNAVYCLKGIEQSYWMYTDLLTTYALLMVGEVREAQDMMFDLLKGAKREYGLLWWESDDDASTESFVEMTAYGILCLLKLGGPRFTAAASDAVKWITRYRNQNGGFISTQDTILALEAISKLSASLPRMSDSDKLVITMETMNRTTSFDVTRSNLLLQQQQSLPPYLNHVKFAATSGKGCALVQTHLKYNVRHGVQHNQLKIQLKIHSLSDIDLYFATKFSICVRHKSATEAIRMAVLEVFMVSGFYPDRTSLYEIPISRKGVRKWEEYEDKVVFYFEDLKQKKVCVDFLVNQEVCVDKTNPALIKLYDYYNYQQVRTVKYNLQPDCNNGSNKWLPEPIPEPKGNDADDYHSDDAFSASANTSRAHINDFVDSSIDMETPDEMGPLPLYVPSPLNNTLERNCPHCLDAVPIIFPSLYCSAHYVFAVKSRGNNVLDIFVDLSPRPNLKLAENTISFIKGCSCQSTEKENSTALILITPRHAYPSQQLILDNSTVVIPLHVTIKQLPGFLIEAMNYCRAWSEHGSQHI